MRAQLRRDAVANDSLNALRAELDRELAALGKPGAGSKLHGIFATTPAQIARAGKASVSHRKG